MNRASLLLVVLLCGTASWLPAADLRIEGDRLSLHADNEPIPSVLAAFARQGVRVKLDPAVTDPVTIHSLHQDAEAVLRAMLVKADYMVFWKKIQGPLDPIPVLEEIQVYRPGRKEAVQPLSPTPVSATNRILRREYMAGEMLVRVAPGVSPDRFLALVAQHGGRVVDSIPGLGLYKIVFPPDTSIPRLAAELTDQGLVASAEPNYVYRLPVPGTAEGSTWAGGSGAGSSVRPAPAGGKPLVAVLDTGFGNSGDPLISWLDAAGGSTEPIDLQGHGTQMALLAQGFLEPLGGMSSAMNPLLPVLSIRISEQDAYVAGDTLMKSLQATIDQHVRVVSLSWGSDMPSAFLKEQLDKAMAGGVVVVAAAGNVPSGTAVYPAAFPGVLAVGGTGADGKPAAWSNYGDFLGLSAPGYVPLPVMPGGPRQMAVGTSVSTAYAANVLGQYFRLHPDATTAQALADLKAAVTGNAATVWDTKYGDGLLDANAVSRFLKSN
jgi:hypothetical protein